MVLHCVLLIEINWWMLQLPLYVFPCSITCTLRFYIGKKKDTINCVASLGPCD